CLDVVLAVAAAGDENQRVGAGRRLAENPKRKRYQSVLVHVPSTFFMVSCRNRIVADGTRRRQTNPSQAIDYRTLIVTDRRTPPPFDQRRLACRKKNLTQFDSGGN